MWINSEIVFFVVVVVGTIMKLDHALDFSLNTSHFEQKHDGIFEMVLTRLILLSCEKRHNHLNYSTLALK